MKLLVLSFYFQPDLCAGSFRSTALIEKLRQFEGLEIDVITTLPNRYSSYTTDAPASEKSGGVTIHRIGLPAHQSGMLDQAKAFYRYYSQAKKIIKGKQYNAVYATSSRLFTAFLGARISRRLNIPLYLDIRDIFVDTIKDVLPGTIAILAKPVFSAIERYTFRRADRINLVSKGFGPYFSDRYPAADYRWFTNGIDEIFLEAAKEGSRPDRSAKEKLTVLYAGNIGEGQGLHHIIPGLAHSLDDRVDFRVIGDGGRRAALLAELKRYGVSNVELLPPVNRDILIEEYLKADVLFMHLNDYPAFEKVLPSKIFEYAAMGKPILAGVAGYSASFLKAEVDNCSVFQPGNVSDGIAAFSQLNISNLNRKSFKKKFSRRSIAEAMARDIYEFTKDAQ